MKFKFERKQLLEKMYFKRFKNKKHFYEHCWICKRTFFTLLKEQKITMEMWTRIFEKTWIELDLDVVIEKSAKKV